MDGKRLEYKREEALKGLEKLTANAEKVQEQILKEILAQNGETEYLNKFLVGVKDIVSQFKSCVPVITYKEIRPYIVRIANGEDSNLITARLITEMLCSSGTSARDPKLIPLIAEDLDRRTFVYNLIMPIINQSNRGMFRNVIGTIFSLKPFCDPDAARFTLLPNMTCFEFIPLGENGTMSIDLDEEEELPQSKLVDLFHVKLGYYYELVVTTFSGNETGLNSYRIGNVFQVTGFHNQAPQFRFICRRNVVLSIDIDKTNEEDLHRSITVAKKLLEQYNALPVEYTSYANTSSVPGHYVIYWEIIHRTSVVDKLKAVDAEVLQECCIAVEEQLDYVYRRCRTNDKVIGPLEIRVVKPGTFKSLMDFFINQGGSINRYKTPRCIKSKAALKILNSIVRASYFSPRDHTWKA